MITRCASLKAQLVPSSVHRRDATVSLTVTNPLTMSLYGLKISATKACICRQALNAGRWYVVDGHQDRFPDGKHLNGQREFRYMHTYNITVMRSSRLIGMCPICLSFQSPSLPRSSSTLWQPRFCSVFLDKNMLGLFAGHSNFGDGELYHEAFAHRGEKLRVMSPDV
jgi:hypothetical protein